VKIWSSNTNAVFTDQCQPLGDVTVNLAVTEDLVTYGDGGFSLQPNAYPMPGVTCAGLKKDWIQFSRYADQYDGLPNNTAAFQWQAWALEATAWSGGGPQGRRAGPTQPVPNFTQPDPLITSVANNRLPKGSNRPSR
jgi:hypothetical protein